jgi:DNA-binding NarL/FixJ family response regulator
MARERVELVKGMPRGLRSTPLAIGDQALIVMSYPLPASGDGESRDPLHALAPTEREVIHAVLSGLSNAEIAALRGRSVSTINKQIESAYRKLGVGSRGELGARFAHARDGR